MNQIEDPDPNGKGHLSVNSISKRAKKVSLVTAKSYGTLLHCQSHTMTPCMAQKYKFKNLFRQQLVSLFKSHASGLARFCMGDDQLSGLYFTHMH